MASASTTIDELRRANAALQQERDEALAREAALAEVLDVINHSPGDPQPVFDAILGKTMRLCGAAFGALFLLRGNEILTGALRNMPEAYAAWRVGQTDIIAPGGPAERLIDTRRTLHILDMRTEPTYGTDPGVTSFADIGGARTVVGVPLMRDGVVVGFIVIFRQEVRAFSDRELALLESFAAQAVIAMENARLLGELQARTEELAARNSAFSEQIDHQSATIEVLKAMSASPGDAQPVFQAIVSRARTLCNSQAAALFFFDGTQVHYSASDDEVLGTELPPRAALFPMAPSREFVSGRAILDKAAIHIRDAAGTPGLHAVNREPTSRSQISIPLMHDAEVLGAISLASVNAGGFSDTQIELLKTFAEQAVIAIRGAETFRELQARTAALDARNRDYGERIEHQSATIEVLKVMSATPVEIQPVFDLIARQAQRLCDANAAVIYEYDGRLVHFRSISIDPSAPAENVAAGDGYLRQFPTEPRADMVFGQVILRRQLVNIGVDDNDELHSSVRGLGMKFVMGLPLLRDGVPVGAIVINTGNPLGFSESQVALLQTFAEQAVIAIGSVATYRQLRERTAALTRSVAELQALEEVLRAVNSSLDLETVLATVIDRAVPLAQADEGVIYEFDAVEKVFVPKASFGMTEERIARLRERRIRLGETYIGRAAAARMPLRVEDAQTEAGEAERGFFQGIRAVLAVPLLRDEAVVGGLVIRRRSEGAFAEATVALMQTFAAQSVLAIENARLFEAARRARAASDAALGDLRRAQDRLVQTEKMASLGQLTAGIAHEIKNPLNFVNNFSELSTELIDELQAALVLAPIEEKLRAEVDDITSLLKSNLEKVVQHGKRADGIVKNMLLHSRESGGELRSVEVNSLVEEALNLAYHGARAEKPGFNIALVRAFDPAAGVFDVYPQEFTRVLLNLFSNGFYAATRKQADGADPEFEPMLTVTTEARADEIAIRVRDNGIGIPDEVHAKMFEPFFTTKPAGEGTGLGLSLSHDIVVKQHGGSIGVESRVGVFTEFTVTLPRPGG